VGSDGAVAPSVSSAARSSIVVAGTASIGQGLALLATPLLTRIYEPTAFGVLAIFLAISFIAVSVASVRFEYAIPIAPNEETANTLLVLALLICVPVAFLAAGVWSLAGGLLEPAVGRSLSSFTWIVAISVLVGGAFQALTMWSIRRRQYRRVAAARLTQAVGISAAQLGLGIAGAGTAGLVIGDALGRSLGTVPLLGSAADVLRSGHTLADLREVARSYASFAAFLAAAALLNTAAFNAPFLLLPAGFGASAAGLYFLAYRVLILPASLVGSAVGQVLLGEAAARRRNQQELQSLAVPVALALFAAGLPVYTAVAIAGPDLFAAIFGETWREAGQLARLLAPAILVWAIASPLSGLLVVGRREQESLIFTGVELATRVAAIGIGIATGSIVIAVVLLSASGILLNLGAVERFLRPAATGVRDLLPRAGLMALLNVPGALLIFLAARSGPGPVLIATVAATCSATIALGLRRVPELRRVRGETSAA
jgi:lipopolysaccharide exporter